MTTEVPCFHGKKGEVLKSLILHVRKNNDLQFMRLPNFLSQKNGQYKNGTYTSLADSIFSLF